jgi:hypothetical protein
MVESPTRKEFPAMAERATTLPHKLCELNKQIVQTTLSNVASVAGLVGRSIGRTLDASRNAGKTVTGQTRAETGQAASTVVSGIKDVASQTRDAVASSAEAISTSAKTVAGQARAQGSHLAAVADRQANHVVDEASRRLSDSPSRGTAYEDWTKAQLLDRARQLDVDGRATMNKAELIDALRG